MPLLPRRRRRKDTVFNAIVFIYCCKVGIAAPNLRYSVYLCPTRFCLYFVFHATHYTHNTMTIEIINVICLTVGFFVLQRLYGNEIFSHWQFNWLTFLLSLLVGFFSAAFMSGILESMFPELGRIEFGSPTSYILIALYILIYYIAITHIRLQRSRR